MEQPKNNPSERIARVVSEALREARIGQREAAARTGLALNTLSRRLTGHSSFKITELDLIAGVLGTSVLAIVARAEDADS